MRVEGFAKRALCGKESERPSVAFEQKVHPSRTESAMAVKDKDGRAIVKGGDVGVGSVAIRFHEGA
ncbi:hypothetical protein GCM10009069_09000 [Algimonas arctica]|uniref:Uncharacterized protein n=1 Tax=Algimonas arctica TaxID=1479486 RepID=A0A8J3CPM6_9PROT|nr:hypothetical protein GCM10009069_09000 [Algimonas arctica]